MKVLHTADWHLGKKLELSDRTEEQQDFLDWLIDKLINENIDVLIIAGDIFDTGSPTNTAFEQYYGFLSKVKNTKCTDVIIIGGNHDSVSTLNAPKRLLKFFNVHIVGGVPEEFTDQIIVIENEEKKPGLVVCAVPFLRDKDIRLSISGEQIVEREARIKKGIKDHYDNFIDHIAEFKANGVPVIATGHLFASGSSTTDSEKEIHVGNLGQVAGDQFPKEFDYIALGHLHRSQVVGKLSHIRYSGSPIPLSFSESDDIKHVIILQFNNGELSKLEEHIIPSFRKLLRFKGSLENVKKNLLTLNDPQSKHLTWVEVQIETDAFINDLDEQLTKIKAAKPFIDRFFPRQFRKVPIRGIEEQMEGGFELSDLTPRTVFIKRCEAEAIGNNYEELLQTFDELLEQIIQKED